MSYIFVFGIGHSGTTLCASILGSSKDVHLIPFESGLLLHPEKYSESESKFKDILLLSGKKLLLEKTPAHLERSEDIRRFFPSANLVCTIRNPLDIYASFLARSGSHEYSYNRVFKGLTDVVRARDVGANIFNYEDFIKMPDRTALELCESINLKFESRMLRFWENNAPWFGIKNPIRPSNVAEGQGHNMNRAWQVRQPIFDGRNRWLDELNPDKVEQLITVFHPISRELGYDLTDITTSAYKDNTHKES